MVLLCIAVIIKSMCFVNLMQGDLLTALQLERVKREVVGGGGGGGGGSNGRPIRIKRYINHVLSV